MLASLHLMDGKTRLREAKELAQSKWQLGVGDGSCGWGKFVLFGAWDSKEQNVPYS